MPEAQQPKSAEMKQLQLMKSIAVSAAMYEIVQENRDEIIRRTREKLSKMNVNLLDREIDAAFNTKLKPK